MSKSISHYLIIILALFLGACASNEKDHKHETHELVQDNTEVLLNNGKPWSANPETTRGIETMVSLIHDFQAKESSNYSELKDSLEVVYNRIFLECTMKGEAHVQLHNYLLPMVEMFNGILADSIPKRKENIQVLHKHLESFPNYFE